MLLSSALSIVALTILSQPALALPEPRPLITPAPTTIQPIKCFTHTVTVPALTRPPLCPLIKCVAPLDCIATVKKVTTVPCRNIRCPITPTATFTATTCPGCTTGCAKTTTITKTVTTGCAIYTLPVETYTLPVETPVTI